MSFSAMLQCRVALIAQIREQIKVRNFSPWNRAELRKNIAAYRELQRINRGEAV